MAAGIAAFVERRLTGGGRLCSVTGTMLREVAQQVGDALWELPETASETN
jgi:hypothetical protein